MRIDRIELTTSTDRVELPFHRQVTLIRGLGRLEREALYAEVLGALGAGRPGLSVDVIADDGRYLELHRPLDGPPSVHDAISTEDVTDRFLTIGQDPNTVSLLRLLGLSRSEASEILRFGHDQVRAVQTIDDRIAKLAAVDQGELWGCAIRVAELEVEMATLVDEELPTESLANQIAEEIEQAHAERDIAAERLDHARSYSLIGSGSLALIAFFVALITHPLLAIPFILAAVGAGVWSWQRHREYETAAAAERDVLERAGMASYLNFQLKKVDELTSNSNVRSRSLELAELHRHARQTWEVLVGRGVTLEWLAANRATITEAANLIVENDGTIPMTRDLEESFAEAFIRVREAVGEAAPLLVDDVFSDLTDDEMHSALSAIDTYAPHLQFVLATSDPRVLAWAQRRAEAGAASIVQLGQAEESEPLASRIDTPSIVRSHVPAAPASAAAVSTAP